MDYYQTENIVHVFMYNFFFCGTSTQFWVMVSSYGALQSFIGHTTLGTTPLDEYSARRRDLYLTIHNTHNRQTFMPSAGFEPTIPASEQPQTHALDCVAHQIVYDGIIL